MENPTEPAEDKWVPHDNKSALCGYYLAIFSFIPLTGIITSMLAIGAGVKGLKYADGHQGTGKKHALFAMFAGLLFLIVQTALVVFPLLLRE